MTISYNIGYSGVIGPNVMSRFPTIHIVEDTEDFISYIRSEIFVEEVFNYVVSCKVIASAASLFVTINDEGTIRKVLIKMINVREYRTYWEKRLGKNWEKLTSNLKNTH